MINTIRLGEKETTSGDSLLVPKQTLRTVLFVLLFGCVHGFKGRQTGENGSTGVGGQVSIGRRRYAQFRMLRGRPLDALEQRLSKAGQQGAAAREHNLRKEFGSQFEIGFQNGIGQ